MKKTISLILFIVSLLCLFTGCSSQESDKPSLNIPSYAIDYYENVAQIFREAGFTEAHFVSDNKMKIYLDATDTSESIFMHQHKEDGFSIDNLKKDSELVKLLDILLKYCYDEENLSQTIVDDMHNKINKDDGSKWIIIYEKYDVLFHPDNALTYIESISVYPHGRIKNLSE